MPNLPVARKDGESKRFRSIEEIFLNPAEKAKLTNLVDEAVRCKTRIQLEQETIKQLRETAKDELSLNPKLFNYYVAMVYSNDYSARKDALDQLDKLVSTVMGLLPPDHSGYTGEDND